MAGQTRVTQKIFGGSLTPTNNIAQFGSLKAGSPAYSNDPAVIQGLTGGWPQAWAGACVTVDGIPNVPAIEDMNAVLYVLSYQLAYILSRGLPEWITDTAYNKYDICRKNGVIYESLVDSNTGNDPATAHAYWVSQSGPVSAANATQSVSIDGAYHTLNFNTINVDPDGQFNTSTYTFTASAAGIYRVSSQVQVDNVSGTAANMECGLRFWKNGASAVLGFGTAVPTPGGLRWYPKTGGLIQLAAGDTIQVQFYANDSVRTGLVSCSNGDFSIERVRAV